MVAWAAFAIRGFGEHAVTAAEQALSSPSEPRGAVTVPAFISSMLAVPVASLTLCGDQPKQQQRT
jgi:hypothetical protein